MSILLHICCAPCLIYPLERLKAKGVKIKGFYYNPNIYPPEEYLKRSQAVREFSQGGDLEVFYPQYRPQEFSRAIGAKQAAGERCLICWKLRLSRAAKQAQLEGFSSFSTTLLVSPYQDHESIKRLGIDIGKTAGVDFYYEDFRPGFGAAQKLAKALGIYRQKYCGCAYSDKTKSP